MKIAIKEASILLLIAFALAGVTRLVVRAPQATMNHDEILLEEATKRQVLWIDARNKTEYAKDHIPDAVNLNEDAWEELLPSLLSIYSPDKTLVVYCDSDQCDASRQVAKRLRDEVGLKNIFILKGGWQAWLAR
jgi:rhodanese-related sulfurtransferase